MNKIIFLLGASNNAKGELSQMAIDRLECAYTVYSNNSNVKFLCTGGFGEHFNTTKTSHAEYLEQWLHQKGVKENEFLFHILSSNTYDDIQGLNKIINYISNDLLIVITSDFHMKRVCLLYQMFICHENVIFIPATSKLKKKELLIRIAHEEKAILLLNSKITKEQ